MILLWLLGYAMTDQVLAVKGLCSRILARKSQCPIYQKKIIFYWRLPVLHFAFNTSIETKDCHFFDSFTNLWLVNFYYSLKMSNIIINNHKQCWEKIFVNRAVTWCSSTLFKPAKASAYWIFAELSHIFENSFSTFSKYNFLSSWTTLKSRSNTRISPKQRLQ